MTDHENTSEFGFWYWGASLSFDIDKRADLWLPVRISLAVSAVKSFLLMAQLTIRPFSNHGWSTFHQIRPYTIQRPQMLYLYPCPPSEIAAWPPGWKPVVHVITCRTVPLSWLRYTELYIFSASFIQRQSLMVLNDSNRFSKIPNSSYLASFGVINAHALRVSASLASWRPSRSPFSEENEAVMLSNRL